MLAPERATLALVRRRPEMLLAGTGVTVTLLGCLGASLALAETT